MVAQPFAAPAQLEQATKGRIKASDPWVVEALFVASAAIRAHCGWHVSPVQSDTIRIDGTGDSSLSLPSLKIVSIEAVSDNGTALLVSDLGWSENGIMDRASLTNYGGRDLWERRRRGVLVTFTHGHDLDQVPELVHLACTLAARSILDLRTAGYKRESTGPVSAEYLTAQIMPFEELLLRPYTLPGGV